MLTMGVCCCIPQEGLKGNVLVFNLPSSSKQARAHYQLAATGTRKIEGVRKKERIEAARVHPKH